MGRFLADLFDIVQFLFVVIFPPIWAFHAYENREAKGRVSASQQNRTSITHGTDESLRLTISEIVKEPLKLSKPILITLCGVYALVAFAFLPGALDRLLRVHQMATEIRNPNQQARERLSLRLGEARVAVRQTQFFPVGFWEAHTIQPLIVQEFGRNVTTHLATDEASLNKFQSDAYRDQIAWVNSPNQVYFSRFTLYASTEINSSILLHEATHIQVQRRLEALVHDTEYTDLASLLSECRDHALARDVASEALASMNEGMWLFRASNPEILTRAHPSIIRYFENTHSLAYHLYLAVHDVPGEMARVADTLYRQSIERLNHGELHTSDHACGEIRYISGPQQGQIFQVMDIYPEFLEPLFQALPTNNSHNN